MGNESLTTGSAEDLYGKDTKDHLSTDADIARFRKWVRATGGKQLHLLSYRSYLAAHFDPAVMPSSPQWDDGQLMACLGKVTATDEKRISDNLQKLDFKQRYDCIIHTEHLEM